MAGRIESQLIELARSPVPEGHSRCTIRLLEKGAKVLLEISVSSRKVIYNALRKINFDLTKTNIGASLQKSPKFITCMVDVLAVYELPYTPKHPVVCIDEKLYHLLEEIREPLLMISESDWKTDSEYVRNGTVSIFAFVEPLGEMHHVYVHERMGRGH